jgi:glucose uptake protein GlcU
MIGGGAYLGLMGILMFKNKDVSMRKSIGIYNMVVGGLSIVGGIFALNYDKASETIFNVFIGMIIISFIILNVLKIFYKKN